MEANALDLVLVLALALGVRGGLRSGLVARVAAWVGALGGIVLAARTVPLALAALPPGGEDGRVFIGVLVLGATVSAVSGLVVAASAPLRRVVAGGTLGAFDRGIGAIASGLALGLACWFVLPTAADLPGGVARQVRGSVLLGVLDGATPEPPDALRGLRALLGQDRFPEVFAELVPAPDTGPPPELLTVPADVTATALASTVNVEVDGCGRRYEGSGVTLAAGTVVTNAHVVSGADRVVVRLPDGSTREATVVVLDGVRDLAVLEVEDHPQAPLPLATAVVGEDVIVVGHPGGQDDARVAPARVARRTAAIGRDVTGRLTAERLLLFLAAELRPGDSGGPVVDARGAVIGVVFAISPDDPSTAYALDVDEVTAALAAPRRPGEVGRCLD